MSAFNPPTVDVGDSVLFYRKGDPAQAYPGLVTQVWANGIISLNSYAHNRLNFTIEHSIRHHTDPEITNDYQRGNGTWDLAPTTKVLSARLQELEDRLQKLEAFKAEPNKTPAPAQNQGQQHGQSERKDNPQQGQQQRRN